MGTQTVHDALAFQRIVHDTDLNDIVTHPVIHGTINSNSPLQLDILMGEGLMALAEFDQPAQAISFAMSGAMTPATMAGVLTDQTAEISNMVVLAQIVRAGAPVIYRSFTFSVDLRSGSPAFGTPEYARVAQASGQLTPISHVAKKR